MVVKKFWVRLLGVKNEKFEIGLEKIYISEERRQSLAETDKDRYYNQEEWLDEFLDNKGAFYNGSESNDDENYNENVGAVVRRCSSKFLKISQISQLY